MKPFETEREATMAKWLDKLIIEILAMVKVIKEYDLFFFPAFTTVNGEDPDTHFKRIILDIHRECDLFPDDMYDDDEDENDEDDN